MSPAFKPGLIFGGLAVAGGVVLEAIRPEESVDQVGVTSGKIPAMAGRRWSQLSARVTDSHEWRQDFERI